MRDWITLYKSKLLSADEAMMKLPDKGYFVITHTASEPKELARALARNAKRFCKAEIFSGISMGTPAPYLASELQEHFQFNTFFASAANRPLFRQGLAEYTPGFFSEYPGMFYRGERQVDVALISISKPDKHGYCSLGLTVDYQRAIVDNASVVIAQMNEQLPRTLGDCMVHISEIDYIVEYSETPPILPLPAIGEEEREIGRLCASLIQDGDTMQLGIGGLPDAVLDSLKDKNDLGLHTEMFSDRAVKLIELGVINNKKKTLHKGVSIATFLMGSASLYEYVDDNPAVGMYPVSYTNDPYIIAQNDNMVSINSCLQIDLLSQVAADTLGPCQFSGVGGQVDFVRGAKMSKNGRTIIAMPSTADGGKASRIVMYLNKGSSVTTTRHEVDYVVTEYGIAKMRGKCVRERANALIALAHPKFRNQLREEFEFRLKAV